MRRRSAFTMIELIFVIVVIGIIAKFGVEFLIKAYDGYLFSSVQNRLQSQTEIALEEVSNRLQYRIKPSVIVRDNDNPFGSWRSLSNAANNGKETILEWVGYDIDGQRGGNLPYWSGFIDLDDINNTSTILTSPETNTTAENNLITALSYNTAGFNDTAIFFIGANSDINGYGWAENGVAISDQTQTVHPVGVGVSTDLLVSNFAAPNDFTGRDVYEYYQLAWTAYALVWNGTLNSNDTGYAPSLDGGAGSTNLFANVLPTPLTAGTQNGQWREDTNNTYTVKVDNTDVNFTYNPSDGSFTCTVDATTAGKICKRLTN